MSPVLSRVAFLTVLATPLTVSAQGFPSSAPWPETGFWPRRDPGMTLELERPRRVDGPLDMAAGPPQPARRVPLPPTRPAEIGRLGTAPGMANQLEPITDMADCFGRLQATGARYVRVGQPGGNPACAIDMPIRLAALKRSEDSGDLIILTDRPVISCRLALQFDAWIKATGPILAAGRNAPLVSMITGPGWECRTRNRQPGAPLSSHGNGLALDVNTFVFANKSRLSVTGSGREPTFQAVRRAACTLFTTVLGPGSDGFHEDHLHVDIQPHGRGRHSHYCR